MLDGTDGIPEHLEPVWYAFRVLSASRSSNGYGPNPIPVSEILSTADFFCLDPEEAVILIQGMDLTFIEEWQKKQENQRKARQAKRGKGGRV